MRTNLLFDSMPYMFVVKTWTMIAFEVRLSAGIGLAILAYRSSPEQRTAPVDLVCPYREGSHGAAAGHLEGSADLRRPMTLDQRKSQVCLDCPAEELRHQCRFDSLGLDVLRKTLPRRQSRGFSSAPISALNRFNHPRENDFAQG